MCCCVVVAAAAIVVVVIDVVLVERKAVNKVGRYVKTTDEARMV